MIILISYLEYLINVNSNGMKYCSMRVYIKIIELCFYKHF